MIQVEKISDSILAAVKKLRPKNLAVEDNKIIIGVTDPQKENPDLVQVIVSAGGRIQSVYQLNPGLEETYLKVVGETK